MFSRTVPQLPVNPWHQYAPAAYRPNVGWPLRPEGFDQTDTRLPPNQPDVRSRPPHARGLVALRPTCPSPAPATTTTTSASSVVPQVIDGLMEQGLSLDLSPFSGVGFRADIALTRSIAKRLFDLDEQSRLFAMMQAEDSIEAPSNSDFAKFNGGLVALTSAQQNHYVQALGREFGLSDRDLRAFDDYAKFSAALYFASIEPIQSSNTHRDADIALNGEALARQFKHRVAALAPGERLLVPANWHYSTRNPAQPAGHSIAYKIQRDQGDTFTFTVLNANTEQESAQRDSERPGKALMHPELRHSMVERQRMLADDFWRQLGRWSAGAPLDDKGPGISRQNQAAYDFVRTRLGGIESRWPAAPSGLATPQRSGSCPWSSGMLVIRSLFRGDDGSFDRARYKKFVFKMKSQAIVDFYERFAADIARDPTLQKLLGLALQGHVGRIAKLRSLAGAGELNRICPEACAAVEQIASRAGVPLEQSHRSTVHVHAEQRRFKG